MTKINKEYCYEYVMIICYISWHELLRLNFVSPYLIDRDNFITKQYIQKLIMYYLTKIFVTVIYS